MPEASSGCVCTKYPVTCSVVMQPRGGNSHWGTFSGDADTGMVAHLAVNLGAPGDRRAADGTLWLAYPRPSSKPLVFKFYMKQRVRTDKPIYKRQQATSSDQLPWVHLLTFHQLHQSHDLTNRFVLYN